MGVPVVAVVRPGPDVELDIGTVRTQLIGELVQSRVAERILIAGVDPDRLSQIWARGLGRCLQDVVAFKVGGVVERSGRRFTARVPDGGRMGADRAEQAGVEAGYVERPEATHRDPADGDPPRVGVELPGDARYPHMPDVGPPATCRPLVPIRVIVCVRSGDDRSSLALVGDGLEDPRV